MTGATGLIGSAVCRLLAERKYEVWPVRHSVVDLRAPIDVNGVYWNETDAVIHCGARISGVAGQLADPAAAVTDNLVMTARILEAVAKAKPQPKKFVFLSSSTVYPAYGYAMKEDCIAGPDLHYEGVGGMKVYCEQLCAFYRNKYGLQSTILRPTAVYGPGDRSDHVIPDLIRRALATPANEALQVNGSAETVRDFVYVDDVAEACIAAITGPAGPFNIGSGEKTTLGDLATCIAEIAGHAQVRYAPEKAAAISYRQVDISWAKKQLGWTPKTSLQDGIKRTVDWMKTR